MQFVIRKAYSAKILFLLVFFVLPFFFTEKAEAAGFQETWVRIDRMTASTFASGLLCAKTPVADTAGTEIDVQVVFPADFTVSTTLTDWAVSTAAIPSGAAAWPGIGQATAANNGTHTVTFPSTVLTTDTLYCFQWTNTTAALQTGSAGASKTGTIATRATAAAAIDSSGYSTAVVSAGGDQIGVTASVPATFTFALGGALAALGTLSTSTASATGVTASIATNAAAGWVAWVKSANAGLLSSSTSATIPTGSSATNDTPLDLAGADGYVLDVDITTDNATGTGTITQAAGYGAEYAGSNTTSGGNLSTAFQPIAASDGTTAGDVLTLIVRAKISAVQAAATDYADTLTVVAAGRF